MRDFNFCQCEACWKHFPRKHTTYRTDQDGEFYISCFSEECRYPEPLKERKERIEKEHAAA